MDALPERMYWDQSGKRPQTQDTYCKMGGTMGCNVWVSTANMVGSPDVLTYYGPNGGTTGTAYSGTVTKDSTLKMYLNEDYYNSLGTDKSLIDDHLWNIGAIGTSSDTEDIALNVQQEELHQWRGKVGLISLLDYMRTTTETECSTIYAARFGWDGKYCDTNNWLKTTSDFYWTMSIFADSDYSYIWFIHTDGNARSYFAANKYLIYPVVYIDSNIGLTGTGENVEGKRFQIVRK